MNAASAAQLENAHINTQTYIHILTNAPFTHTQHVADSDLNAASAAKLENVLNFHFGEMDFPRVPVCVYVCVYVCMYLCSCVYAALLTAFEIRSSECVNVFMYP